MKYSPLEKWLITIAVVFIILMLLMPKVFSTNYSYNITTSGTYQHFTDVYNSVNLTLSTGDTCFINIYISGQDSSGSTPNNTWGIRGTGVTIVNVADSNRHGGVFDSTKYFLDGRNYSFRIYNTGKIIFDGIQFFTGNVAYFDDRANNNVEMRNCIAYGGTQEFFGIGGDEADSSYWYAYNCLFQDISDPIVQCADSFCTVRMYNCTFDNCERSVYMLRGKAYCKNNVYSNNSTGCYATLFGTITSDDCVSTDAYVDDFSGSNNQASATIVYQDSAYDTLWLDKTSDGYQDGANLSSDTYLPFSTDIVGDTRATPWNMGIKEDESAVTAYPFRRRRMLQ